MFDEPLSSRHEHTFLSSNHDRTFVVIGIVVATALISFGIFAIVAMLMT